MNKNVSVKFANLSWLCSIMVVMIHADTYAANLPGKELQTVYGLNATTYFELFFTEGICKVAVPLFFVISGYLYYRNFNPSAKWHFDKILKRLKMNGIPYLFWGLAVIIFFLVAQSIPATAKYFATSNRKVLEFSVLDWLKRIFISPINSPLWFLRDLLILACLSPIVTFVCKKMSWLWIAFVAAIWMQWISIPVYVIRIESILFFSIGSVLSLHHRSLIEREKVTSKKIAYAVFVTWIIFLAIKTYHLCTLSYKVLIDGEPQFVHELLTKINIVIAIPVLWCVYEHLPRRENRWKFGQYSFLMFVMHHPVISVVKKLLLKLLGINMLSAAITFVLSIIITCTVVVLIGSFLKKLVPRFYAFVCGGR